MAASISDLVLWLLPGLFLLHDAEEAALLGPWLQRNRTQLEKISPHLFQRLYPHLSRISGPAFVAMAAEELIVLLGVTLYALISGNLYPWLALLLAFGVHLIVHIVQAVVFRSYVPSVVTSLLCLPVVVWLLSFIINSRSIIVRELAFCAVAGVVVAGVNLLVIHRIAARMMRS